MKFFLDNETHILKSKSMLWKEFSVSWHQQGFLNHGKIDNSKYPTMLIEIFSPPHVDIRNKTCCGSFLEKYIR